MRPIESATYLSSQVYSCWLNLLSYKQDRHKYFTLSSFNLLGPDLHMCGHHISFRNVWFLAH